MRILVYMRDGRTVYLLDKRGYLAHLVGRDPWHEKESFPAVRGIWNPSRGVYNWAPVVLRFIAKGSIAYVEEARNIEDAVPPPL